MIVALCRFKLREDAPLDEYGTSLKRMKEIVSEIPGFISNKVYVAEDGERVTIYEFESEKALDAWHGHPEHIEIQKRSREAFYDSYYVAIMDSTVVRAYDWTRAENSEPDTAPWWYPPLKSESLR